MTSQRTIEKLLRQQAALAKFGSFAFAEEDLQVVLSEAARICAVSLGVPFSKICRHRPEQNDLLVVAGYGWEAGVVGNVASQADESSTQGRAFVTGEPVILEDIGNNNSYALPAFYANHGVVSTVDVLIKGSQGPFGVLEADCSRQHTFDEHDINFLTGFANVVAEAVQTTERTATLRATVAEMGRLVQEKEALIVEKNMFAEEMQHRVRNNLQLVYGMLVQQINITDDTGKEGIRAIARRVMSLAAIYDHLLGHGLVQTIDFGTYLKALCDSLESFQEAKKDRVSMTCEAESVALDIDTVTALGIITAEVTSNAYLHAFPGRAGTIRITFSKNGANGILTITDDGTGFKVNKESKRHGLGLIKRLMEQIRGTAEMSSENGTRWTLIFPVVAEPHALSMGSS